jgi:hypothetical protein
MALKELPNGMTYFSLSEELKILVDTLFQTLTPVTLAVIGILTVLFIAMIIYWVIKVPASAVGGR